MAQYSSEHFFDGQLSVLQPAKGYRYSMDPFVLCRQVPPPCPGDRILDIGCGCGIMSVILGYCFPLCHITGIEIQAELAKTASQNVFNNQLGHKVSIINQDINTIDCASAGGPFDLIVSNPPYKKHNTGRLNPDTQKAVARHEIAMDIEILTLKAADFLRQNGRLMIIFPFERLADIFKAVQPTAINPEWIRYVYTTPEKPPKRVIFSGRKKITAPYKTLAPIYVPDSNTTDMNILHRRINP